MKLLIASDIHGDLASAKHVIDVMDREGCDKLVLLGDILYHGPRNELPDGYEPKRVIALLNEYKNEILAVRGNCDTEVDQMVLDFPMLADYAYISADGFNIFATHGHNFNTEKLPPLKEGDLLLHGHTHVPCAEPFGNRNIYINPGSVSIPKMGSPKSYIIYSNREFSFRSLDGEEYKNIKL